MSMFTTCCGITYASPEAPHCWFDYPDDDLDRFSHLEAYRTNRTFYDTRMNGAGTTFVAMMHRMCVVAVSYLIDDGGWYGTPSVG